MFKDLDKLNIKIREHNILPSRITKGSKLFKNIVEAIKDKKGEDIISLDLKKIDEAVADYFILCDAKSNIQIFSIADNIIEKIINECKEKPYHVEYGDNWTIIDYVNIVIHIFKHEHRLFYNLESLWGDAPKTEF